MSDSVCKAKLNQHGTVGGDFRKLVAETASVHSGKDMLTLAQLMGPADEANHEIPSGYTFFGQFVDQDITFSSQEGVNAHTPLFDLDSLYGDGPDSKRHGDQYETTPSGEAVFKIGNDANEFGDLFRDDNFMAKIPDPRNDENIIIASLHLLFQKFHNKLVNDYGLSFVEARQTVIWHYQSVVLNDFLPKIIGDELEIQILSHGRKIYLPKSRKDLFIPAEFSGACYRFWHSMVRQRYSFNHTFFHTDSNPNLFFGFPGGRPPGGGHQITRIWSLQGGNNTLHHFFDPGRLTPPNDADNYSGKIDTSLPQVLFNFEVEEGGNNVLAHRNLITGQKLELPNGQQTVEYLKSSGYRVDVLSSSEIKIPGIPMEMIGNTPLWYYTLREAEVREGGAKLGALGGIIVGETLIGLLQEDCNSFIHPDNSSVEWKFSIPGVQQKQVSMLNILDFVSA
jgi:hypothetical protein